MTATTWGERERHVRQLMANLAIEGMHPDGSDKQMLQAYIDGTATLDDLLEHAKAFAAAAQCQQAGADS